MLMSKCRKYAVRHKILVDRSMYQGIRRPVRDGIKDHISSLTGRRVLARDAIFTNIQSLTGHSDTDKLSLTQH